jgi:hypothetical protein
MGTKNTFDMSKTISLKLKSRENMVAFIKRFTSIEKFILLELTPSFLICKSATPDHSTVKFSKMSMDSVLEGQLPQEQIRLPLADATKMLNVLKKFAPTDEIFIDILCETSRDKYLVGLQLTFRTDRLKIVMLAGDINLVTYISPDVLKGLIGAANASKQLDLPFKPEYFTEIMSLLEIDIAKDKLVFNIDTKGRFTASGSNFEAELDTVQAPDEDVEFKFKATQFFQVESDTSVFELGPNYVVIRSQESDTITIISNIQE